MAVSSIRDTTEWTSMKLSERAATNGRRGEEKVMKEDEPRSRGTSSSKQPYAMKAAEGGFYGSQNLSLADTLDQQVAKRGQGQQVSCWQGMGDVRFQGPLPHQARPVRFHQSLNHSASALLLLLSSLASDI